MEESDWKKEGLPVGSGKDWDPGCDNLLNLLDVSNHTFESIPKPKRVDWTIWEETVKDQEKMLKYWKSENQAKGGY